MRFLSVDGFDAFEWDEAKRAANFKKHSVDFLDVARLLGQAHVAAEVSGARGDLWREPERRWLALIGAEETVIAVIYTLRGQTCRIISARGASRNERKAYHTYLDR